MHFNWERSTGITCINFEKLSVLLKLRMKQCKSSYRNYINDIKSIPQIHEVQYTMDLSNTVGPV